MNPIEEIRLRLDQIDMYARHTPVIPADAAAIRAAARSAKAALDKITEIISEVLETRRNTGERG